MHAFANSLIVFGSAALGCLAIWVISRMLARQRKNDAAFQRSLSFDGRRVPTGQGTGVPATGRVTVEQLQARINGTAGIPVVQKAGLSNE